MNLVLCHFHFFLAVILGLVLGLEAQPQVQHEQNDQNRVRDTDTIDAAEGADHWGHRHYGRSHWHRGYYRNRFSSH